MTTQLKRDVLDHLAVKSRLVLWPPATDLYENIKVISRFKTTQLNPDVLDHLAVKSRLVLWPPATDLYENIKKVIYRYKTTQLNPYVLDHLAVKSRLLIHIEDSRAEYVEGVFIHVVTENWRQTFLRWFRFRQHCMIL